MQTIIALSILFSSFLAKADVSIPDYDWSVTDISEKNLSKEEIFSKMDRTFMKMSSSICANRALLWLNDFKRDYQIDGAKIFLFYTSKSHGIGLKRWWYHVAPVIAEQNQLYVMDAGFGSITAPMTPEAWMSNFSREGKCKEIQARDSDLIALMNQGQQFPTSTVHGEYNCYYKIVPAGLWFPRSVSDSLSGGNVPNEIQSDEVYSACVEAVTTSIGRVLGGGKKTCRKYVQL